MHSSDRSEQHVLEAVLARAATDREFRRQLLVDPRPAIYTAFGVRIPEDFRVKFIEKEPDVDALIVLPGPEAARDELSEGELEAVTGGGASAQATWKRGVPPRRGLII